MKDMKIRVMGAAVAVATAVTLAAGAGGTADAHRVRPHSDGFTPGGAPNGGGGGTLHGEGGLPGQPGGGCGGSNHSSGANGQPGGGGPVLLCLIASDIAIKTDVVPVLWD